MSDTESLNTSILSDTSSDTDDESSIDINVFEFDIDGNKKICGLNKPQDRLKSKNPINKDTVLNKKELEFMLKSIGRTAHSARNTKIKEACNILYEGDTQQDSNNNINSKKKCSYIQNSRKDGLECLNTKEQLNSDHKFLVNKMSKPDTNCEDLTHTQLVTLAKIFNTPYKGKKNQICNHLVKYFNKNQNQLKLNECYKNIKSICNNTNNNCNWLFESKDLLIQRLELLDLLSNNKNHKSGSCNSNTRKEYTKCSVEELLFKLRNTFNMKHLTSRCINKTPTEKTKSVINNYKLTIFRETLKFFYNDTNNLNDILTSTEIDNLNKIIDSFNTNNKHTTLDEFIVYEKQYYIFLKILQKNEYLTTIVENICKLEIDNSSESKEIFIDNIFKVLESFNLSNLQNIKNNNFCNFHNYNQNNDSDDDTLSSESLSDDDIDDDTDDDIDDDTADDIDDDIDDDTDDDTDDDDKTSKEINTSINTDLQYNLNQQYLFLQNNSVGKLYI